MIDGRSRSFPCMHGERREVKTLPSPARVAALEKIKAAAGRMSISVGQFYLEAKAGRVGPIVKIGRASAVPSESVDAWIAARIEQAKAVAVHTSAPGARHE